MRSVSFLLLSCAVYPLITLSLVLFGLGYNAAAISVLSVGLAFILVGGWALVKLLSHRKREYQRRSCAALAGAKPSDPDYERRLLAAFSAFETGGDRSLTREELGFLLSELHPGVDVRSRRRAIEEHFGLSEAGLEISFQEFKDAFAVANTFLNQQAAMHLPARARSKAEIATFAMARSFSHILRRRSLVSHPHTPAPVHVDADGLPTHSSVTSCT